MEVIESIVLEEIIFDTFEQKAQHTIGKLRLLRGRWISEFWLNCMHDMHFQVKKLAIDGVL